MCGHGWPARLASGVNHDESATNRFFARDLLRGVRH
jgi:hypothetical protein